MVLNGRGCIRVSFSGVLGDTPLNGTSLERLLSDGVTLWWVALDGVAMLWVALDGVAMW